MFESSELKDLIEKFSTLKSRGIVLMEWNLNVSSNIAAIGNYRYRPLESGSIYRGLTQSYDINDSGRFYTDATDADIIIDGGYKDNGNPQLFPSKKEKVQQLYSLEDCFNTFRPRSGINKLSYFSNKFTHHTNSYLAQRPRYYMSDKKDRFKYWSSFRTEDNIERGVAKNISNGQYYIDDACPFVVYKNKIPANRLVIKMQTNVGTKDLGPFSTTSGLLSDPLFGNQNKTTPVKWKIQVLRNNNWVDVHSFNSLSQRSNGLPIIGPDGYLELSYGLIIPEKYSSIFIYTSDILSSEELPERPLNGFSYLVKETEDDLGTFYIWVNDHYESFRPVYGWHISDGIATQNSNFVTDLTDPLKYINAQTQQVAYKEFDYITGVRLAVETMNKFDSCFDLIEISPRLIADVSDKTIEFSVDKIASDLGGSGLPVGQLLASTGSVTITDYDLSFNENNTSSIIKEYLNKNVKFSFYDAINNYSGYEFYVPIKTLYAESVPKTNLESRTISLELRDMFFHFESMSAPDLLLTDVSLSFVISTLLDSIGYSNYTFKAIENEKDMVIPYFFCSSDQTIAEVLNALAVSFQSSMFFDEYNNFVVMSKEYTLPLGSSRSVDSVLYGSQPEDPDIFENIINVSSIDNNVYNDGKIDYTTRYIQRSYGSIKQSTMLDQDKNWSYKPALLWEVTGTENTKSINDNVASMSKHMLSAMPLSSDLSAAVPSVSNGVLLNNILDLGENAYWLTRYNGYLYANGEVIKYDAAQFNVSKIGNVWISSVEEYQNYFSSLPFNGKIYPTGLLRIYSEPDYEIINGVTRLKSGAVKKHGRGQFGTSITQHSAGLNSYWTNNDNVRGCNMYSEYLFSEIENNKTVVNEAAGVSNDLAKQMNRTGVIKNFLTNSYISEYDNSKNISTTSGSVQSSALVLTGPNFTTSQTPIENISYVYKPLSNKFKHFGTRLRIIGKIENNEVRGQTPSGSMTYYVIPGTDPSQNISIGGGSGGLGVMINPNTNAGYYFELAALTDTNISAYSNGSQANNLFFYKIQKDSATSKAVPIKLWSGMSSVIVDDGTMVGQYRINGEENPTVYDISVEYMDIGSIRNFYLYVNNKIIATVTDTSPLPVYNNMCLFTRGSSKLMFENIYALTDNYSQNTTYAVDIPFNQVFDNQEINANEAFRKYAMSGVVQSTYLAGISPNQPPSYSMYFDEFGTIMRECEYFNIKYDKAYPALYAKLSPTFNKIKGYSVSGFQANPFGAEFLIFNATDSALSLDETTGNYLRIQGVAFTQDSQHSLTVDDYFSEKSSFSNPKFVNNNLVSSPHAEIEKYNKINLSRSTYGKKEFSLELPYVQTQDAAKNMMGWIIKKIMTPTKSVGVDIFSNPMIQLGDIVNIRYKDDLGMDMISSETTKYVVYNINYSRSSDGPSMKLYLSEVPND